MEVSPPPGIVILTMHDGAGQRRELLRMGASAFLAKSASLAEILAAVKGANSRSVGTRRALGSLRRVCCLGASRSLALFPTALFAKSDPAVV